MNENDLPKIDPPKPEIVAAPIVAPEPAAVIEPEQVDDICVVARNPREMMAAQSRLIGWAMRKFSEAKQDHEELAANFDIAVKNKWRSDTLKRQSEKALKRSEFYEKILGALEAGYVIVPNLPIDVFAIRTERIKPKRNERASTTAWESNVNDPAEQVSEMPPIGAGTYANPDAKIRISKYPAPTKPDQNQQYHITKWASAFKDVEFPFATARPEILDDTARAMALRLFDDIGVSPSTKTARLATRLPEVKGDPMVVGRVLYRKNNYRFHAVSFLIAWWVNTRELP